MNIKTHLRFFLIIIFFICPNNTTYAQENEIKTIVIDAGHGGKDPGCMGNKVNEKHIALSVSKKLYKLLNSRMKNIKVIMTRNDDTFVELHERANIANKNKADLFISLHCNANTNKKRYGTETYTMGLHVSKKNKHVMDRENKVILKEKNYISKYEGFDPNSPQGNIVFSLLQNASLESSVMLAEKVEKEFSSFAKRKSLGVKQAGFIVLWMTTSPSILIEIGFLTNKKEEIYLLNKKNQLKIAESIYRAIKEYFGEI